MKSSPFMGVAALATSMIAACASKTAVESDFAERGITRDSVCRIVLHGDEATVGSDIKVEVDSAWELDSFWDCFEHLQARRYWVASGWRQIVLYTRADENTPAAILLLNEVGTARVEGSQRVNVQDDTSPDWYNLTRIPGLDEWVMSRLNAEYKARHPEP